MSYCSIAGMALRMLTVDTVDSDLSILGLLRLSLALSSHVLLFAPLSFLAEHCQSLMRFDIFGIIFADTLLLHPLVSLL